MLLPANHLRVVVDGDVWLLTTVVGAKVAVWGTKPLVKAVFQGQELGPVA